MRRENKTQKGTHAKQRKGFSLVELVVVIIIIAILAVAIFAGGSLVIKKAQISRAKSDLHNFDVAIQSYMFSDRKPVGLSRSSTDAEYLTVVNGLNKNLPKDCVLQATGLSAEGKISTALDHKYVYDSDKKDPWGNPYYFLVDPQARNDGETEYFFTVLSAGPNAKATVGGAVDKDDIFLLCQYSNSAVVSQTYSMTSDKKDATGTPLTVGTTILVSPDGTSAPRNIGAARSGPGTGGPGGPGGPGASAEQTCLTLSSPSSFTLVTDSKAWNGTLEYSTDKTIWSEWNGTDVLSAQPSGGDYALYMRGTGNSHITTVDINTGDMFGRWVLTNSADSLISCTGNIETLLDYTEVVQNQHPAMDQLCFAGLFANNTSLSKAPDLLAETLTAGCYMAMFGGCTSLTTASSIGTPATSMAPSSCAFMFRECTSLTTAPQLPAENVADSCYLLMFTECTSLTTAPPALPATTLASECYEGMFDGCSSLTTAPQLPATTLEKCCYDEMFNGCSSLTTAPQLPATTLADSCYRRMFSGCSSLTTAPALPATTLAYGCYDEMFSGCSSLKLSSTQTEEYTTPYQIPTSGAGTPGSFVLTNMFAGTGGTFTGTPSFNTTYYLHKDNSIATAT